MHIGAKHEVQQGLMGQSLVCRWKDMYGGPEVQITKQLESHNSRKRNT